MKCICFGFVVAVAFGGVPSLVDAQSPTSRLHGFFRIGAAGEFRSASFSADAAPTVGFGARYERRFGEYVAVGPQVQFSFWRPRAAPGALIGLINPAPDRSFLLDLGGFIKGSFPLNLTDNIPAEVYGLGSIGTSVSVLDRDIVGTQSKSGFGLHVGLVAGFAAYFTRRFGAFLEFGWMLHQAWHGANSVGSARLNQATMQLGATLNL